MTKIVLDNPLLVPKVQVARSPLGGRGVFALADHEEGDMIEECNAILIKKPKPEAIRHYMFSWDEQHDCMLMGYGCQYNHSKTPNAYYVIDEERQLMLIFADKDLSAGEEILINYGDAWFKSHNVREKAKADPLINWRQAIVLGGLILLGLVFYVNTQF